MLEYWPHTYPYRWFSLTILSCAFVKIKSGLQTQHFFCKRSIRFISPHQQITRTYVQRVPTNLQHESCSVRPPILVVWFWQKHTESSGWADFFSKPCFSYKRQLLLTLCQKGLCHCQHLLTTPKIWKPVEQNVLWRSTRPFFRHHMYK